MRIDNLFQKFVNIDNLFLNFIFLPNWTILWYGPCGKTTCKWSHPMEGNNLRQEFALV